MSNAHLTENRCKTLANNSQQLPYLISPGLTQGKRSCVIATRSTQSHSQLLLVTRA